MKTNSSYVKTQITNTLLDILKIKNLSEINIKELCSEAKVGRASFYRHFSSIEDILNQESLKLIQQWGQKVEQNPHSKPSIIFETLFQHFIDHKEFYKIIYKYHLTDIILQTIKNKIGLIESLSNVDAYRKTFFAYAIFGWINEWIIRDMQEDPVTLNQLFKEQSLEVLKIIEGIYS